MARRINFSPGPGTLPLAVLERVQAELLEYQDTGISMLEHSHRGPAYSDVHRVTKERLLRLLGCADTHEALFMTGGATTQFSLVPMNYPGSRERPANYIDTGVWSAKAIKAAAHFGEAKEVASGRIGDVVVRAPKEFEESDNARYVHVTSNATVSGVQYAQLPTTKAPLIVDMSSDILSRPVDFSNIALAYAGAQKNLGPAGVTIIIVRKDFLLEASHDVPSIFSYRFFAEKDSLGNTAPTFPIYMVGEVLRWLEEGGGAEAMGEQNAKKTELLYGAVAENKSFYRCPVEEDSRSQMNAVFHLPSEELTQTFIAEAGEHNMVNLKGHRSVGGIRVSMYNAMPVEGVEKLVEFMADFAKRKG